MLIRSMVLSTVLGVSLAGAASAEVILDQGFEDLQPPTTGTYTGDSATDGGRWGPFGAELGPYFSDSTAHSGARSLAIVRGGNQISAIVTNGVAAPSFETSYWIFFGHAGSGVVTQMVNNGTFTGALFLTSTLRWYNGTTGKYADTGIALARDTWIQVRQVLTDSVDGPDVQQVFVKVGDNDEVATGELELGGELPDNIGTFFFTPQGTDGDTVYLDDVRVQEVVVPEPGALSLTSLGALALFRRRNRRRL